MAIGTELVCVGVSVRACYFAPLLEIQSKGATR